MIEQKINKEGDLILTSDSIVQNKEKIEQDIKVNLQYILGEWFADKNLGIPYFSQILGNKKKNTDIAISIFIAKISKIENVISCVLSSSSFVDETLMLNFKIQTTFGELNMLFNV